MNYRDLLSGKRRGPLAVALRCLLSPLTLPYRLIIAGRNFGFDRGWLRSYRADVPVISIGNLTVGGTGKTPLVRYVARKLREQGVRVALVSRGYGAEPGEENDEALELAWGLADVPHLQQPDRVEAARIAVEELESELILMDDGFQHRRLQRDLDIVVIDATCPFGFGRLLPRGLLREPLRALRRAGVILISRADAVSPETRHAISSRLTRIAPRAILVQAAHRPVGLLGWPDRRADLSHLQDRRVAVLSAIGNPEAFVETVRRSGGQVIDMLALPDHDHYDAATMERVRHWLADVGDRRVEVICTHKDLVKLKTDRIEGHPVWALLIEIEMLAGGSEFDQAIREVAKGLHRADPRGDTDEGADA
jgi:tetraacyldisaccharide 4'-kinase